MRFGESHGIGPVLLVARTGVSTRRSVTEFDNARERVYDTIHSYLERKVCRTITSTASYMSRRRFARLCKTFNSRMSPKISSWVTHDTYVNPRDPRRRM